MKRDKPQPEQDTKPTPEDLLEKLRQLDEAQLKDVRGGNAGGRCNSRCRNME